MGDRAFCHGFFKQAGMQLLLCLFLLTAPLSAGAGTREEIETPVRQSLTTLKEIQQQEEEWREEKEKLTARFEELQKRQREMKDRTEAMRRQIEAAQGRVADKENRLARIEELASHMHSFLEDVLTTLKTRVEDDPPFLTGERRERIRRLESLMADPDVAISEKYRKVMEALQVEAEYGFTIETYQETVTLEGRSRVVDIFRLGRLALYCLSLDGRHGGWFDPVTGAWQSLPSAYNPALRAAIDIAAKRQPIELLSLPLGRLAVP
ncbi:MAG: DUF3450 domain-containing protein [Desulfacinum sp.]|jgi:septal ring factor EnvC (AmiA/AmiB activator)|nr:DUF3450 domain-containing protein [Desulfacinum sp.]MBZ4658116.1 hypothetical protein [Desulfacinum sp.]